MSSKISNTTSITFEDQSGEAKHLVASATATATMSESINIDVKSIEPAYYAQESITYIIAITNNGPKISDLTLTNNLGSYKNKQSEEYKTITPLSYQGPSYMYTNGIFKNSIEPEIKLDKIIFKIPYIPEKSNILVVFKAKTNEFAPLSLNSKIETVTSVTVQNPQNSYEATHNITVSKKANLKIYKNIVPQMFSQGETISYNLILYNYGNIEAENVKIEDIFTPPPTLTGITIDENEILQTDYSYVNGIFKLPAYGSNFNLKVPSATFEIDKSSNVISILPGITNITITGII